jgi:hypothetical protein
VNEGRSIRRLADIPLGARADLLRVLTSEPRVRVDVIRQFHQRGSGLAEVLIDLEEDDRLRKTVVRLLKESMDE